MRRRRYRRRKHRVDDDRPTVRHVGDGSGRRPNVCLTHDTHPQKRK